VIGAVVFSHWVLDLIVHRDDMPLLPGDLGDVRVGFGLWKVEWASILTEAAIMVVGAYLYWRAAQSVERAAGVTKGRANLVAGLLVVFGAAVLTLDVAVG
jgi:predicted phosphohydrolase